MKQIVACATCAIKDWIDDFYPCYVWKEAPADVAAGAAEHDEQDDEADDDGEAPGEHVSHNRASGPSLRDEDGFCYLGRTKSGLWNIICSRLFLDFSFGILTES